MPQKYIENKNMYILLSYPIIIHDWTAGIGQYFSMLFGRCVPKTSEWPWRYSKRVRLTFFSSMCAFHEPAFINDMLIGLYFLLKLDWTLDTLLASFSSWICDNNSLHHFPAASVITIYYDPLWNCIAIFWKYPILLVVSEHPEWSREDIWSIEYHVQYLQGDAGESVRSYLFLISSRHCFEFVSCFVKGPHAEISDGGRYRPFLSACDGRRHHSLWSCSSYWSFL